MHRTLMLLAYLTTLCGQVHAAPTAAAAPPRPTLQQRLNAGEFPQLHALLVVQHGRTLVERYFTGQDEIIGDRIGTVTFAPTTLHDVRSVTKSVVSLLFGVALAEGAIKDLDTPVLDYFPEYQDLRTPERLQIRLRDLLSMTSGFAWDEQTYPYSDPRNSEIAMDIAPDPLRYVLTQKTEAAPGTRWKYSGGDVELIGAILARTMKLSLSEYAQRKLFAPLAITDFGWSKNKGVEMAASGLRLTPRDMLKIGRLALDGGRYEGRQIVPAQWLQTATARHAQVEPDPVCGTAYGYFWWLGPGCEADLPWFAAFGNGGQRIWVVPSLALIVVQTMGLYNDPRQGKVATDLFRAVIADVRAADVRAAPAPP